MLSNFFSFRSECVAQQTKKWKFVCCQCIEGVVLNADDAPLTISVHQYTECQFSQAVYNSINQTIIQPFIPPATTAAAAAAGGVGGRGGGGGGGW